MLVTHVCPPHVRRPAAGIGAVIAVALAVALLAPSGGCALAGVAANALPAPTVPARYKNLRGQTAAVMVWVDRGVQIDFPSLRLEIAGGLQNKLSQATRKKQAEVLDLRWPHQPASVVRYQDDHPELDAYPVTDVAPRLGVGRLIYVEVESFQTRSDQAMELFRGSMSATLKVIEVSDGRGKIAYEESGIAVTYPRHGPPEGMPGLGDARVRAGTVDAMTTALAKRFLPHPAEDR